jgi:hypothetical protein
MDLAEVIESLHQQHEALLSDLRKLRDALDILDPPKPVEPKPAEQQIRELVVSAVQTGPKTQWQLGKIIGISPGRIRKIANQMVRNGTLQSREIGKTTHYEVKREELRIIAGDGVRE